MITHVQYGGLQRLGGNKRLSPYSGLTNTERCTEALIRSFLPHSSAQVTVIIDTLTSHNVSAAYVHIYNVISEPRT